MRYSGAMAAALLGLTTLCLATPVEAGLKKPTAEKCEIKPLTDNEPDRHSTEETLARKRSRA